VTVQIDHTWIGDLKVTLVHDGATVVMHDREGGSQANLVATFSPTEFRGMSAGGWWTLTVSDHAGMDSGTLQTWSLTLTKTQ
jgi:serine protease